jgi:predicted RND superfamily exporter protein
MLCSGCVAIGGPGNGDDDYTTFADIEISNSLNSETTATLVVRNTTTDEVVHEEQIRLARNESREFDRFDDGNEFNVTVAVGDRTNSKVFTTTDSKSVGLLVILTEDRIRMMLQMADDDQR